MSTNAPTAEKRTATEPTASARPDDCQCWNPEGDLACWPCYRDGFDAQNPDADPEDTA